MRGKLRTPLDWNDGLGRRRRMKLVSVLERLNDLERGLGEVRTSEKFVALTADAGRRILTTSITISIITSSKTQNAIIIPTVTLICR
jgi:hypothetical protein